MRVTQDTAGGVRSQLSRAVALIALVAAACGSGTTTATTSAQPSDPVVVEAKANVAKASAPESTWYGPTTGPKAATGKKIACVAGFLPDETETRWCTAITAAAKAIGWQTMTLDGKGTLSGMSAAILQALSNNVNGLILAAIDASSMQDAIGQAIQRGVTVITIQGLANPGPSAPNHVFTVVTQRGQDIGKTTADIAIADSQGTAQGVVIYDSLYEIARIKGQGMVDELKRCSNCKVLEYLNSPFASATTLFGGQMTSMVQKYPGKVYYMAIADYYFDYGAPALKAAGVPSQGQVVIVGTDGSPATYQRIRTGEYEIATIPPPANEQGWEAVDEMNRAFNQQPWSGYIPPVQVINKSNLNLITAEGYYDPPNGYQQQYKTIWGVA
jgi:ribose transport system substrate-binding protein